MTDWGLAALSAQIGYIVPGCIRLRNDLYCVGWGVKLYSLTRGLAFDKYVAVKKLIGEI